MKSKRTLMSIISLILGGLLVLGACGSDTSESTTTEDSAEGNVATSGEETTTDGSGTATLPADIPAEIPVPDFPLTEVIDGTDTPVPETTQYVLYFRGTDVEADAELIRSLLLDAGFDNTAWGVNEERGATGVFLLDENRVTLGIQDTADGVEILYDVGTQWTED